MIFLKLLASPVLGPMRGTEFLLNQVKNMADQELYGFDHLREQLLLLQLKLEQGEITEEEFAEQEADIILRLRVARERQGGGGLPQ